MSLRNFLRDRDFLASKFFSSTNMTGRNENKISEAKINGKLFDLVIDLVIAT